MKTLSLFLLLSLSFLASAPLSAQVNCTTYSGGETSCDGPGGYHAEGRQYFGGIASWHDNGVIPLPSVVTLSGPPVSTLLDLL
jgi:hypothetical protein